MTYFLEVAEAHGGCGLADGMKGFCAGRRRTRSSQEGTGE